MFKDTNEGKTNFCEACELRTSTIKASMPHTCGLETTSITPESEKLSTLPKEEVAECKEQVGIVMVSDCCEYDFKMVPPCPGKAPAVCLDCDKYCYLKPLGYFSELLEQEREKLIKEIERLKIDLEAEKTSRGIGESKLY